MALFADKWALYLCAVVLLHEGMNSPVARLGRPAELESVDRARSPVIAKSPVYRPTYVDVIC